MVYSTKGQVMLHQKIRDNDFRGWTGERSVSIIGSNIESKDLPFQSWKPFKEAFAPEIVHRAISETPGLVSRLFDPFGGSGTSALTSQFLGVKPTTIEVNPFLADLIEAKLCSYDIERLTVDFAKTLTLLKSKKRGRPNTLKGMPPTFIEPGVKGRYIFSKDISDRLAKLLVSINTCCSAKNRRLFRILTATLSLEVSNVVISGKGRRYRKNWEDKLHHADDVDQLFEEKALKAIRDISRHGRRQETDYTLLRGDSRALARNVGSQDVVVFSPPYPNSFDYTDVYNVELWLLGHITDDASNRNLRNKTLRSHVQVKRIYEHDSSCSNLLEKTFEALCNVRSNLWSKDLPEMVTSYFFDMQSIMTSVSGILRPKGRVYCVVGDSQYGGIPVPVAAILQQMDKTCGLKTLSSERFRSMRASPQQGGRPELPETLIIFEKA